ncbi:hypothetical protein GSI_13645 [Ganoderma sinense ZZ0214-1]|uniref:Ribosome biogenesis protein NSA1 n=1 Tax=Ganoderma sinense ZZ0214-1 TaxID=1077348 RepID=A0A2G8RQV8_9APHY|nr:hypothetical protein GSI_13645 [Ganoderma sinense ZZ0214-1]
MPHFYSGDALGALKSVSFSLVDSPTEWKATTTVLVPGSSSGHSKTVQKLASYQTPESSTLLAAVHADGSAAVHAIHADSQLSVVHEWKEGRLREGQKFVGLTLKESTVYTCTSNGALRRTKLPQPDSEPSSSLSSLPMRLCEWRLSADARTFVYGGEEVEMSLWDTEKAFSERPPVAEPALTDSKKRKRGDQLLPGEVWRAKNVPNDQLSLRQPVYNTALTYLQPSSIPSQQHLLAGTTNGCVRRYDTRVARRPVSNWVGIGKVGGVGSVEDGFHEHEVFVADRGSTLSALDLRNGRTIYTYKGISGAVTSVAPAQRFMVSASQDRYIRLNSTFGPPAEVGQQQEQKGEVLCKEYVKVVPTVVVWDGFVGREETSVEPEGEEPEDEVWDVMQAADSDSEGEGKSAHRREKKRRST